MRSMTKLISATIIIVLLLLTSILAFRTNPGENNQQGRAIGLVRPALAASTLSFLQQEAGIAAYTKSSQPINLAMARRAFGTGRIEEERANYIIGLLSFDGYDARRNIHVFVSNDGWIVAYYSKLEPSAIIADLRGFNGKQITNLAEIAVSQVAGQAGVPLADVSYYNFNYPDANALTLVGVYSGDVQLEIPSTMAVLERSYTNKGGNFWSSFEVDGRAQEYADAARVSPSVLLPGTPHKLATSGRAIVAIVFRE